MKINKVAINKYLSLFITFTLLSACSKDDIIQKQTTGINTGIEANNNETNRLTKVITTETISTNFSITVLDQDKSGIPNATVSIGDKRVQTNSNGSLLIENINVNKEFQSIKVEANGFSSTVKTVTPSSNGVTNVTVTLLKPTFIKTFSAIEGGTVSDGGISIKFPKDAIADQQGDLFEGEVTTTVTYYNPTAANFAETMPGTLVGLDDNNSLQSLISKGMVKVDLTDTNGNELEIFEGKEATITLPALNNDPTTIPLWHLNEEKGIWVQTGTATKNGNSYTAKVTHFSTYNLDIPGETIDLTVVLKDTNGQLLANQKAIIKATNNNGVYSIYIETDEKGVFKINGAPKGALYKIEIITSCENIVVFNEIINETSSKELIISYFKPRIITLHGFLKECNNEVLRNKAFIMILDNGNKKSTISAYTNEDGYYTVTSLLCNYNTTSTYTVQIRVFDGANDIVKTDEFVFETDNKIRDITVCNGEIETSTDRIYEGHITIDSDEKYKSFIKFGYTEVTGTLFLENLSNTDFKELNTLKVLNHLYVKDNHNLINLKGLENVKQLNGGLTIWNNNNLLSFEGLNGITKINSDFTVRNNDQLTNFKGLENVTTIEARFFVEKNDKLLNFKGLNSLISVANRMQVFSVRENNSLRNFEGLENLTSFKHTFDIQGNGNLINFKGLIGLTEIQFFDVKHNNSLENFDGLNNLSKISRSFEVQSNYKLKNFIGLERLKYIYEGKILQNFHLTSLTGLNNLERVSRSLEIEANDNLPNLMGLEKLNSILGLIVGNNKKLISFAGINNLVSLSGLVIRFNNSLDNLNGLEKLLKINSLEIYDNENLQNLNGLENLNSVNQIKILRNFNLLNLIGLSSINSLEYLTIEGNQNLLNLEGLSNMNYIQTSLIINYNPAISNLDHLENLKTVGGLYVNSNENLTNFCGLTNVLTTGNNYNYLVSSNKYNPTKQDIINGNCSQ
ncbi:carboxypeptidase-like regulatory domain-containing protein [uncultured Tenacibaculum sp.]|uniref:carboxypeptidase-like regulatory domain-containing protein n=1 Tax=uncultured Tenacibaculum sp. TaxID=174713 RepID=UPI002634BE6B|nr:carboxypeptidase-like regulatory domain-containing protein [uncultured Tenacibaculum sp.]